jgi:hypothetical protein
MKINVGTSDRAIRVIVGLGLIILALFSGIALFDGTLMKAGGVIVGAVLVATGTLRFCPLYAVLGIQTCKV